MKYIFIFIIVLCAGVYFWNGSKVPLKTESLNKESVTQHFSASDLETLGCHVDESLAKTSSAQIPLLGKMEIYGLQSSNNCKVSLISTIRQSTTYDEGTWAGLRASSDVTAKKRGFEISSFQGNLGEYSEITVFTQNGSYRGFTYSIQGNGLLRSITIFSGDIQPDNEFENIILKKI